MRCKNCGGNCKELGGGKYECEFCGAIFSEAEARRSVPVSNKSHDSGVDVFEQNIGGILEIRWRDGNFIHSGSGFLISPDGYAVTNAHVVTSEDGRSVGNISVKIKDENLSATVVALGDNKHGSGNGVDLALVKLNRLPFGAKILQFEDFNNVRIGQQVYVVGNSLGYGTCITSGIVSDKQRNVNGKMLLMTDCAVNGGNSGGPIFNEKGLVIGAMVSGINSAEGMNFAIPSSTVLEFIRKNKIYI